MFSLFQTHLNSYIFNIIILKLQIIHKIYFPCNKHITPLFYCSLFNFYYSKAIMITHFKLSLSINFPLYFIIKKNSLKLPIFSSSIIIITIFKNIKLIFISNKFPKIFSLFSFRIIL